MTGNSILKPSQRKNKRLKVKATCVVNGISVEICDLSQEGMGFYIKARTLQEKRLMIAEICYNKNKKKKKKGIIIKIDDVHGTRPLIRCAFRFEEKLTLEQFEAMITAFDLQSPEYFVEKKLPK